MKSFLLAIAAVQILHCSGVPSTKDALRASVAKLNEITEITNLCAITRRGVTNTYRTGKLSYNVDLTFSVKETVCSKNSVREFDDSGCTFRPKKIAEKGFCKSRVEYFADKVADVDVECEGLKTIDSESDSSESSETSIEVKSKSDEISLEDSSNDNTKSTETSHEHSDQVKDKSKETSIEESSNMKSKSTELSLEESSNEELSLKRETLSMNETPENMNSV
ncbi:secreted phosphoprotein 24-like isoform X2 [Leucoraja erinacea]|uniref:secreted phosphoprotein 24-like isoform X2 n=1 Tax=Leucoraja erinaceus TaxID=7782 RepID=UPI002455C9A2|nr:secreted phosphoprotein 24-like isoform X2 [Leucoraja erinacea]